MNRLRTLLILIKVRLEEQRKRHRNMRAKNLLWIPLCGLVTIGAGAQSGGEYNLNWNTMDGGGGNSQGQTYAVSGTIGQSDTGSGAGGDFRLDGGFWAPSAKGSETLTPTVTPTNTVTMIYTSTPTSTITMTATLPVPTETSTGTPTVTATHTTTPTSTATATLPVPTEISTDTPTITATHTTTPTSTVTATMTLSVPTETPTLTPTPIPGDINGDCRVNSSDLFHFGLDWQESAAVANPRCNAFTDTIINERDLLLLLNQWNR